MRILVILAVLFAVCTGKGFDEEDYQQILHGRRPKQNVDDAISTISCRVGYTITKCECDRPEVCDGAWVRVDKDGNAFCDAYNRADTAKRNQQAVLAKVTCGKLMMHVSTGYVAYNGGKKRPEARCPKNYRLISCSFHSTFIQHENPPPVVKRIKGACSIKRPCKKCRIQAHCIRMMRLVT